MLLQALCAYAQKHRLLEELPLQKRSVHALIALNSDGSLHHDYLVPLTQPDDRGKERPSQEKLMPRFPGENNGGKAYFLAENSIAVLGRDKVSGEPLWAEAKKGKNPTKSFDHFWEQIQKAFEVTGDLRLKAVLAFRRSYLLERDGKIAGDLPFLEVRKNKLGNPEFVAHLGQGATLPLKSATLGFSVAGQPLTMEDENDPLREYWFSTYTREAFQGEPEEDIVAEVDDAQPTLCLVTGEAGQPIARSHKPKILGVPGLSSGGYVVSFAKEAPAFSSYGFEMGQNAPVSEQAAASYALAVNELLRDEDTHIRLGPLCVCSWAKENTEVPKRLNPLLSKAYPEQVGEFLRAPFAGIADREVLKRDRLYTVALTGNAGRVVVQHWLDQTLDEAVEHFRKWWADLQIINLYQPTSADKKENDKKSAKVEAFPSPFAIRNLAQATLRKSKKQKDDSLVTERLLHLYRAALEGTSPPLSLLKPILDEFHSALVKNDEKNQTWPFSQSRFALIKLILIRNNKGGGFMPTYELADTPDEAYNLGRLLAVFENLQDKYHNCEKKGPGVVERYYATASSAPGSVFPILCRLARHHLSKVRRENGAAAYRIEERIMQIMAKFQSQSLNEPPTFPRVLTLEQQGRFALGFYQQKVHRDKVGNNKENLIDQSGETL